MLWLIENVEQITFAELVPLFPCLSEARRERLASFRHESAAVQSALAELLLRHALREEYGLNELPAIETGKKGKPFFPDRPDIQFNLSHCRAAVACALDGAPVGVDVQEVRSLRRAARPLAADERHLSKEARRDKHCLSAPQSLPLEGKVSPVRTLATDESVPRINATPPVYRVLSESERAWVEAGETPAERDRRFTAVWTCKEAYGKNSGKGFHWELESTEFLPRPGAWEQYGLVFQHCSTEAYALTLCAAATLPRKYLCLEEIIGEVTL